MFDDAMTAFVASFIVGFFGASVPTFLILYPFFLRRR